MHRFLLAVVCVLACALPAWAEEDSPSESTPCCAADEKSPEGGSDAKRDYVDPCFCLKEEIETYPVPGGSESRYLGERHDDGCPPEGDCQAPATIYLTGDPNQLEEECSLEQCNSRAGLRKSEVGLEKPVEAGYEPDFTEPLDEIAKIKHTDYLVFETREGEWIRAIVHLVWIPKDIKIRPGQPARMLALGYEVEEVDETKPNYEVEYRFVHQCMRNECQYYVNAGGVTYAVMTASTERKSDEETPKAE